MAAAWPARRGSREAEGACRGGSDEGKSRGRTGQRAGGALLGWALVLGMAAAGFAAPTVWVAPSLTRVRPDDAPGTATQISLYAAKGEYESFQIIVRAPAGGLSNVNVTAPDLGGPQATLYRENYLYLASGSGDWATNRNKPQGPGWYPDALIPFVNPATGQDLTGAYDAVPFSLAAGKNQPIWVDLYVPRTTPAGQYSGVFTVTSAQGGASVTLSLKVWNFTLPAKPALKSCFMYWPSSDGGQGRGTLQSDQELLRNRLNPVSTSASLERGLIDGSGLTSLSLPFWSNATDSGTISAAPSVSVIQSAKAQHQQDLYFYCYSADEISNPALYPGIKSWGRNLHAAGADQLITMSPVPDLFDDGSGTGRSAVDDWVVLPKMYDASRTYVGQAIAKGDEVWSYNCLQQDDYSPKWLLDYAPINYRIQPGFINQSLGLSGLLYWRVDWWTSDPWNNVLMWSGYPAEGMLVYPGTQVGLPGQVVPSVRLKYLRDGADDYDYVQLLKDKGQGTWALSIARTIGPDWTNWTRDPNALEAARIQLGERLDSLAGGSHTVSVTASVSPSVVASGGTAAVAATATDSSGHAISSWTWSDGGAGGRFSPAASAQNPSYIAPTNTSGANRTVTLTVVAGCSAATPATGSAGATLTVQSAGATHSLTVNAYATPSTVSSSGTTALTAVPNDAAGHSIAAWSWSDGGAGGVFSPSASAQNPSYAAPANTGSSNRVVTLTVTATCASASPLVSSAATTVTVQPASSGHTVTLVASASPGAVASAGSTALTAGVTDNLSHTGFAWAWSDSGAGGSFSPSATSQNPTYSAPANTGALAQTVTLTVTATCKWFPAWVSASATVPVTVNPDPPDHTLTVTAAASPTAVASGGTTALTGMADDSLGHSGFAWSWSDNGAGGTFLPSAAVQSPSYQAAANTTGSDQTVTLTVAATCQWYPAWISATANTTVTVRPRGPEVVTVTASASPSTVTSGGTSALTANASDSWGQPVTAWSWSDGGAGGTFLPSATVQNPSYRAAVNNTRKNRTAVITATARSAGASGSAVTSVTVRSGR